MIKTFKHKELNIFIDTDYAWWPMIDYRNGISNPDISISVKFDQLKYLWFESIEEPKDDRIHKAYDYFENDTRCMLWWPNGRELFIEAIEKYMPR